MSGRTYPPLARPGDLTPAETARVDRFLTIITLGLYQPEAQPEAEAEPS